MDLKQYPQLIIISIMLIACGEEQNNQSEKTEVESNGPELVWSDEFDYEGAPDPEKWGYREGGDGWGNDESQFYTKRPENVNVVNGNLVITASKESFEDSDYTSAAVVTYGKQDFLYGRVEVRAKLPSGIGTWPAIWLLGNSIREGKGWPACGELDIMENVGFDPDTVHANIHTEAYNHKMGTNKGNRIYVPQPDQDYHIYAMEWGEEQIDFFVDDRKYFSFEKEGDDPAVWPFDQPHYLLINLAIGGSWGGLQGIDDDQFPHQFFVDYVRYYRNTGP